MGGVSGEPPVPILAGPLPLTEKRDRLKNLHCIIKVHAFFYN